ncbi:P-loop containing nucleoside triphosphate hydrolase protein [Hypoxylon sp. FL1857]|nr:P-loop containing nucleoside triphosphate hydrolase protein [Hypoxylon sp. FL1857]
MSFPTKENLCTRFATELILRHTNEHAEEKCRVTISPSVDRSDQEKARLEQFQRTEIPDKYNIGALVDEAKEVMGVGIDQGGTFCKDILRIELSGPTQPHLTIVDLPGLLRAGTREQSAEDAAVVQSLVLSYMKNPRSIILAMVSAQSNFASQEVIQHAREIDPRGVRTLGIITKPDILDVGSASERDYFDLVQNRHAKFRLGWHVVRNRDFKTKDATNKERDRAETEFFDQGVWAGLPRSQKGATTLRTRLSELLKDQLLDQLPEVLEEIQVGLDDCSSRLEKLGPARSTLTEQRKYLLNASHQFSNLITEAKDGFYQDKFFGNAREDEGYRKRLRAVVQNTLTDFSHEMRMNGQARKIVETASRKDHAQVSRADYLREVKDLMSRTRGCELPGTYNPLIVGELFHEQCTPWRKWLEEFSRKIFEAVDFTVKAALAYIVDEDTKAKLWRELISDALDRLNRQLRDKINEVLRPHEDGHPITYNHYVTETVQRIRTNRLRANIMIGLKESRGKPTSLDESLELIMKHAEEDMETMSSSNAVDWMEAYYKVALKQVVDDFSKLAIEACLISKLPDLFTLEIVFELSDNAVGRIAAESWETADERKFLIDKMEILSSGMAELRRLSKHHRCINDIEDELANTPGTTSSEPDTSQGQPSSQPPEVPLSTRSEKLPNPTKSDILNKPTSENRGRVAENPTLRSLLSSRISEAPKDDIALASTKPIKEAKIAQDSFLLLKTALKKEKMKTKQGTLLATPSSFDLSNAIGERVRSLGEKNRDQPPW